jgi:hypothetical protein
VEKTTLHKKNKKKEKNKMERTRRISGQTLAIAILTLLLVASLVMSMTGAWFTSSQTETNGGMTFGTITLADIDEIFTYTLGEDSEDVLMPGDEIEVEFTVENAGTADMWVRFALEIGGDGDSMFAVGADDQTVTGYTFSNGYYYRQDAMLGDLDGQANETEDITLTFAVPSSTDDDFEGQSVSFSLTVDAVQAANNQTTPEAAAWTNA